MNGGNQMKFGTLRIVLINGTEIICQHFAFDDFKELSSCLGSIWPKRIIVGGNIVSKGRNSPSVLVICNKNVLSMAWEA